MRRICDGVVEGAWSTLVAAIPLLVLMLTVIAIVEWNHEIWGTISAEQKQQEESNAFRSVLFQTVVIIGSQLPALLMANTYLALLQIKVSAKHAVLAGTIIFLLNWLLLSLRIYPHEGIGVPLFFLFLPLAGAVIPFLWRSPTLEASLPQPTTRSRLPPRSRTHP